MDAGRLYFHLPVTNIPGVGEKVAEKLDRLNIRTYFDVLLHLPFRYEDRSCVIPIAAASEGNRSLFQGTVFRQKLIGKRQNMLLVSVRDDSGILNLRFFNFHTSMARAFSHGRALRCFGVVREGAQCFEIVHPEITWVDKEPQLPNYWLAVYPLTEGLHQPFMRKCLAFVLAGMPNDASHLDTAFPNISCSFYDAIHSLHRPSIEESMDEFANFCSKYHRRIAVEELCAQHLSLLAFRKNNQSKNALPLKSTALKDLFIQNLPFTLTQDQQSAIEDICSDVQKRTPMLRLLQGDVGCGKTVVSAAALLMAAAEGYQGALMAPTELLAQQHFQTFSAWFNALGIEVALVSSSSKPISETKNRCCIFIGTHALFQENFQFKNLALVVIDEQHRFGVDQRMQLSEKAKTPPHQLIMSATPIPRTLAMTFYGDLSQSIIQQLPSNRKPIQTSVLSTEKYQELLVRLHQQCLLGKQAYWVCPLIDESEAIDAQSATTRFDALQASLPEVSIGMIHGRMKAKEKRETMQKFIHGTLQILVATTVIEVGVDVPNASIIVIENAERLGLAQLHQLRGRVGRGEVQSQCLLLYSPPLSQIAQARLQILRDSQDGFLLAEKDLSLRGAGELLGTRQTGNLLFKVADLSRDKDLLPAVHSVCGHLLKSQPETANLLIDKWYSSDSSYISV